MPNQPTPVSPQPPPDVPPGTDNTLTNYLRSFSLWCRNGFATKIDALSAQPGLLLQAYDAPAGTTPKVFLIRVNTAGAISATAQAIGTGRP